VKKKDYNYIASVEKAIAEKYGKNTVQDFRSNWEPDREQEYLEQLKQRRFKGYKKHHKKTITIAEDTIIHERPIKASTNRTCPVCKTYSFSVKDDLYMNRFQSCYLCYIDFIQDREDRWSTGWQPNEEHLLGCLKRRKK
tara:strand:- start:7378 stop:7794 length:417 start_codon:yes stop_codon:yes gene_type:complete